ncbi:MAG: Mu-like prophage major head subunit gpT family protein [Pseudomonadota bacterium]
MYQVCEWIERFALADFGLGENEVEDAAHLRESELEPLFREKATTLPVDEAMNRITALRELGRRGKRMDSPAEFREVMTTAHFTDYFGDAISRAFYADYEYSVGAWKAYTYADAAPDFRDVDRYRMSEPGTLTKRREKAQHAATYISDSAIHYGVEEYSREFDVSWRVIVNDDLGKIRETPQRMANAARRWLDAWVSALYDNATTQAALLALGAVYGGTGRLTAQNLAIGLNAMMQRVDANGNQMNINRVHLVIPKILQIQAADILQDLLSYGGAGSNVLAQFVAGVHVDPYIAFAGANVPWYLFADPSEVPTVTVVRMQGWPGPITIMRESDIRVLSGSAPAAFTMGDFATGNIWFAVEDIVGGWDDATYVGVTDFRGIYYSNGTTV